jgi:hypothetical protein
VPWTVINHDDFEAEYDALPEDVQDELTAVRLLLEERGPQLGRPYVDTLKGSRHANMKEIRVSVADGEWRFAIAFDPKRRGVVLIGGDKSGVAKDRFYKPLIKRADERFDRWLAQLRKDR